MNYKTIPLSNAADIIVGYPFASEKFNTDGQGTRLVRGKNITTGTLRWGDDTRWWDDNSIDLSKYALKSDDIVIGMDGSLVGKNYAKISPNDLPLLLVQRVACVRAKAGYDQRFLWSCISSSNFERYIDSVKTGTSIPHISSSQIGNYFVPDFELQTQKKISSVFSALDDKIELNKRINDNLYAQAKAIFTERFINIETLPDGWQKGNLLDIANYLNGLAMQKFRPHDDEVGLPVLKIKELRQGSCDASSELCSPSIKPEYIVHDGDVIFSWSGSLLVDIWCGGTCGLNQHLFKVTSETYDKWFYYLWTAHHLERFIAIAADKATTMGHIKRGELTRAEVLIPSDENYKEISSLMNPLFNLIVANRIKARKLTELRDELLPKLMSGEIDVSDIQL